jgi:hypothetical protein
VRSPRPLIAGAQEVGKVYRIGYLGVGRPEDQLFQPVFEQGGLMIPPSLLARADQVIE